MTAGDTPNETVSTFVFRLITPRPSFALDMSK